MAGQITIWWFAIQAFGLAGLPLTTFLFRALPDRGYAFSKTLGLLVTSYVAWLLTMLGLGVFRAPMLVGVAVAVAAVGVGVWIKSRNTPHISPQRHRDTETGQEETNSSGACSTAVGNSDACPTVPNSSGACVTVPNRTIVSHVGSYLRTHWASILIYEIIFLLALIFLAKMRAYFPDPWGTERPMDFAFFNAIQRSDIFPPSDPWLAGYSINYYYFGYLMMAAIALLSGLDPAVSFNLSLALVFALTAINIAGILSNMIALSVERSSVWRHMTVRAVVMLLGIVLVLFASNQAGALQVIIGDHRIVALDGKQLVVALQESIGDISREKTQQIELPHPVHTREGDFGTFTTLNRTDRIKDFNWWWPSRALWDEQSDDRPDTEQNTVRVYNITEFPFFSFWLGDMHPHVMALPFGLLAMALALTTLVRRDTTTFAKGVAGWGDLLLAGLILGSLYAINSWDLPTYTLLQAGALFFLFMRHTTEEKGFPWRTFVVQGAMLIAAMFLLFVPFYLTFHSFAGANTEPLTSIPILSKLSEIVAPLNGSRTGLHAFLIISGLFVIPLVVFSYLTTRATGQKPQFLEWLFMGAVPVLFVLGMAIGFPLLALMGLALLAFWFAWYHAPSQPVVAFALLVVALGSAICFGTDIIFIRDVFNSRMNTIFKFYYQVWLIWGTLSAYVVWWLLSKTTGVWQRATTIVTIGVFVLLLAGSLVYPSINLYNRTKLDTPKSLAGITPRQRTEAGKDAIAWLREHAEPGSVVLEMVAATGGSYNPDGYAGVSASTGIPTVLGWAGHERQWRGGHDAAWDELEPRQRDVDTIYSSTDTAETLKLLHKYGVTHIYVGTLERRAYHADALAKFDKIATPVFDRDEITIYALQ